MNAKLLISVLLVLAWALGIRWRPAGPVEPQGPIALELGADGFWGLPHG